MIKPRREFRLVALMAVAGVVLGAPARAQAGIAACPAQPLAQVFLPWVDPGWYASVADGGFEADGAGWTLGGGATVVDGNERYFVRAPSDRRSLALGASASAASPPTCISARHATLRLFVRNTGSPTALLRISLEFADALGLRRTLPIGALGGGGDWSPSPVLPIAVNAVSALAVHDVTFAFSASGGDWRVDDIYVDPYGKG
jgi:hypothetical protein